MALGIGPSSPKQSKILIPRYHVTKANTVTGNGNFAHRNDRASWTILWMEKIGPFALVCAILVLPWLEELARHHNQAPSRCWPDTRQLPPFSCISKSFVIRCQRDGSNREPDRLRILAHGEPWTFSSPHCPSVLEPFLFSLHHTQIHDRGIPPTTAPD